LLPIKFISLSTILELKEYLAKKNNLPNHHGAGSPKARGPMQLHRLHQLKAGPACNEHLSYLVFTPVFKSVRPANEEVPFKRT